MERLPPTGPIAFPWRRGGRAILPVWGGVLGAVAGMGIVLALPGEALARLVDAGGLIGWRSDEAARAAVAGVAALLGGAVAWSVLFLLFGRGGPFHRAPAGSASRRPSVRRADAHPDAPPRHPMAAAELGTPPSPPPPPERGLPDDLDQPLAAFDPGAIPAVPRMAVRPVASGTHGPAPLPRNDDPSPSIAALIDRGARRRLHG
ncbi:hypothetical protein [Sphingomonas rubra]|uniref:Uncharacterized protein n=1 Tax=Sphingomonas rubra TaxID=634430 RepID=A0A1I5T7S2_9SPHN|nr:hypothetical protein [Sphingomonas rubra]SFP79082.1 hypothetical protein SAMN04488241_107113 [Sphingomonas rubra]